MSSSMVHPDVAARESNQRVVKPTKRELLLDIDTDADYKHALNAIEDLRSNGSVVTVTSDKASKSGLPRRHVTIEMDHDLTSIERIALQACLGSDRKRELLSIMRLWLNEATQIPPTVFFEPQLPDIGF